MATQIVGARPTMPDEQAVRRGGDHDGPPVVVDPRGPAGQPVASSAPTVSAE